MLRLKPFILLIIFLKQVVFLISASIQDPKNEIQKQSSMYSQSLPKEKLFILESEETQHESKFNNFAESNDKNIEDDGEIDVASAVHQSNNLNEMINEIKGVETFQEQLELNELSAFDNNKNEKKIPVPNPVSTFITPLIESNLLEESEDIDKSIKITTTTDSRVVIPSTPYNDTNQNNFQNFTFTNKAESKTNQNSSSQSEEKENKDNMKGEIVTGNSIHSVREPNISQESKTEVNSNIEELSLWEKVLLGLRCARQDCQDTFIVEAQDDEQSNRLIKGWKITRRARRNFACPCKNTHL